MSPLGAKRTFNKLGMSAKWQQETHAPQQFNGLFDHLVGAAKQREWNSKAKRLCRFRVDG